MVVFLPCVLGYVRTVEGAESPLLPKLKRRDYAVFN